jgi:hypothetical protein
MLDVSTSLLGAIFVPSLVFTILPFILCNDPKLLQGSISEFRSSTTGLEKGRSTGRATLLWISNTSKIAIVKGVLPW